MKDKFRVRFGFIGWRIEHSIFGIVWRTVSDDEFRVRSTAVEIAGRLRNGESLPLWFKKPTDQ
jgi:hypothetical protein